MSNIQDLMDSLVSEGISADEAIARIKAGSSPTLAAPDPSPVAAAMPAVEPPVVESPEPTSIADLQLDTADWYYQPDELIRKDFTVKITGNTVHGVSPSAEWSEKLNMMLIFNLDEGQMLRLSKGDDTVYQDLKTGKSLANMFAAGVAWPDEFLAH